MILFSGGQAASAFATEVSARLFIVQILLALLRSMETICLPDARRNIKKRIEQMKQKQEEITPL